MQTLEITERFFQTFCHTYCKFYKNQICNVNKKTPQIEKCPIPEFAEFNQQLVKIKSTINKILEVYDLGEALKTKGNITELVNDHEKNNRQDST